MEVAQDFWTVGRLRDARFIRIENHRTEAIALEAAGLRELAPEHERLIGHQPRSGTR